MAFRFPKYIIYGSVLYFLGVSVLLYEFPNNLIQDINNNLAAFNIPVVLPPSLGTYWAFVYAFVPLAFSILVTVLVAKGVHEGEVD